MLSFAYAQDFAVQTHLNIEIYFKDCCGKILEAFKMRLSLLWTPCYQNGLNMLKAKGAGRERQKRQVQIPALEQ